VIITERIENLIHLVRGQRVMLDEDLAALYGVSTKALVQAVKRNLDRFPQDFMFQLTEREFLVLRSQFVTSKTGDGRGGRRSPPYGFTELGVAMPSSVLRSRQAIRVNIEIMRAFVRLRRWLMDHAALSRKIDALEKRYDGHFKVVFDALRQLMEPIKGRIGFHPE